VLDLLRAALSRVRSAFAFAREDDEFTRELASHLELATQENIRRGMSPGEAKRQARLRLGGTTQLREEHRSLRGLPWLASVLQDVRYAWRVLLRSPGFTLTAVLTLALGIAANAVVFAALNAFILRPLNVPRPESLYSIHRTFDDAANQSYPDYVDLRDRNRAFEDLAAYSFQFVGLDTGHNPARAWGVAVSGNYFDVLGIQPHRGRLLHASDEHGPDSAPYLVLGYAYWLGHFQGDPDVVGRTVELNKHPFTIVGVAPPEFRGTLLFFNPDFYAPIVDQEQLQSGTRLNDRGNRDAVFMVMGHLKAGVTTADAAADVNANWSAIVKSYPDNHRVSTFALARPGLYGEHLGRPIRTFLSALMLLAVLILVAACANLGSLFSARAADRTAEMALRLALGAGPLRILRQLLTEALLISVSGGALGLAGAVLLLLSLRTWQPFPQYPLNVPLTPDASVYAVAVLLAVASGLLFGAVPVRQVLRTDPYAIIRSGSRSTASSRVKFQDFLVVGQLTICAVLVTSSLVAVRGLARSLHSGFGFEPRQVMLANTLLDMAGYSKDAVPPMQQRILDAMQTIPGVTSVALVDHLPMNGGVPGGLIFRDDTGDLRPANAAATADFFRISSGYLRAARTALLAGRDLTLHDDQDAPRVAIINQELARTIFGSLANAIGRDFKLSDGTRIQVVGVVEDGKYDSLTEDPTAAVFLPILQFPASATWLVVRSDGNEEPLVTAIKSKLSGLDPALPPLIQTWESSMALPLFPARMATAALGVLGLIGAMLSVTGVFGMAAYSVSHRLKELGIRMALGAQNKQILRAALARPVKVLALGSIAGLFFGILASRLLAFVVFQATPRDPVVLAGAVLVMALLGVLATWIPAQRALSLDPLMLLRDEQR
jgi:predicted permease